MTDTSCKVLVGAKITPRGINLTLSLSYELLPFFTRKGKMTTKLTFCDTTEWDTSCKVLAGAKITPRGINLTLSLSYELLLFFTRKGKLTTKLTFVTLLLWHYWMTDTSCKVLVGAKIAPRGINLMTHCTSSWYSIPELQFVPIFDQKRQCNSKTNFSDPMDWQVWYGRSTLIDY